MPKTLERSCAECLGKLRVLRKILKEAKRKSGGVAPHGFYCGDTCFEAHCAKPWRAEDSERRA